MLNRSCCCKKWTLLVKLSGLLLVSYHTILSGNYHVSRSKMCEPTYPCCQICYNMLQIQFPSKSRLEQVSLAHEKKKKKKKKKSTNKNRQREKRVNRSIKPNPSKTTFKKMIFIGKNGKGKYYICPSVGSRLLMEEYSEPNLIKCEK